MRSLKEIYNLLNEEKEINEPEKIEMLNGILYRCSNEIVQKMRNILSEILGRELARDLRDLHISFKRNSPEFDKIFKPYKDELMNEYSKSIDSQISMQLKASGTVKK